MNGIGFKQVVIADDEAEFIAASSKGYGFKTQAKQLDTNAKAGKAFLSLPEDAQALDLIPVNNATHLAILSSAGRVLIVDLADLPSLNKGKGNKLIQLDSKDDIVTMLTLSLNEIIQVVSGQQQLKLKGDDLLKYVGKRGTKGQLLPRGYQKANKLLTDSEE